MSLQGSVTFDNCLLNCPNHSSAAPESTLLTACLCHKGWSGENGQECSACSNGYYKSTNGSAPCTPCANGNYSDKASSECTLCPTNSFSPKASPSIHNCTCNLGYDGPDGGPCAKCSPGYTGPDGGPCTPCSLGKYKPINGSDACSLCANGTYLNQSAGTSCLQCPYLTTSLWGQTYIENCTCVAGYTGSSWRTCQQCIPGKYKDSFGSFECFLCPSGKYSNNFGMTYCSNCPTGKFGIERGFTNQGIRPSIFILVRPCSFEFEFSNTHHIFLSVSVCICPGLCVCMYLCVSAKASVSVYGVFKCILS